MRFSDLFVPDEDTNYKVVFLSYLAFCFLAVILYIGQHYWKDIEGFWIVVCFFFFSLVFFSLLSFFLLGFRLCCWPSILWISLVQVLQVCTQGEDRLKSSSKSLFLNTYFYFRVIRNISFSCSTYVYDVFDF